MRRERLPLTTGITMNVALTGPEDAPAVILLHGFPESHRTWRALAPLLSDEFRLVMPDQRGFGDSDRPQEVDAYQTETLLADLFALADALGIERFALVGHDQAKLVGEQRRQGPPGPVRFREAMEQDHRRRILGPGQRDVHRYAGGKRQPFLSHQG